MMHLTRAARPLTNYTLKGISELVQGVLNKRYTHMAITFPAPTRQSNPTFPNSAASRGWGGLACRQVPSKPNEEED